MRVLMLHNRYRSEGGEERAVRDIAELLRARGHAVEVLERSSTGLGRAGAAKSMIAGGPNPEHVADAVRRHRADVVHAHNLHPRFGWRALAAARAGGARTVLHLHNFRLFCAIGIAYRDGEPCFRCHGRDTLPGLRLRCRGSVAEAAVYAAGLSLQQPRLLAHADAFVAVSRFTAGKLIELGLPAQRTSALTNFVPAANFAATSSAAQGRYAFVSGRLVEEKGFDTAIAASRAAALPLVIAGEGPDETRLRSLAAGADVRFTGRLAPRALAEVRARAAVVLVPSRCDEACPYSALDALAAGVPVLGSDRGALSELLGDGAVLAAADPDAWGRRLAGLWRDPATREARGAEVLRQARKALSEDRFYERLMAIYGA